MNTKAAAAVIEDEEDADVFGAAFAEANKVLDPVAEAAPAAEQKPAEGEQKPAEGEGEQKPAEGEGEQKPAEGEGEQKPAEGEEAANDDDKPVEPKPAAKREPDVADKLLDRLEKIVTSKPEPAPAVTQTPEQAPEIYSAEEKEILANHMKDWPEVAKAEALQRRGEYHVLTNFIFKQVLDVLKPFKDELDALAERAQYQEITAAEPDYDDVREGVLEWVGKQPTYLQTAFKSVIANGTPEEITDLVRRYKADTGYVKPQAAAAPATEKKTEAKKEPELSTATKQAAAALAPVSSKRSEIVTGVDMNDFNAAFEQFSVKPPT